jgi:membrane-bound lytic murein transglycosylase D
MLKGLTNILPKNFGPSFLGFCFVMMWSSNNAQNIEKQEDSLVISKTEPTEIKDDPQAAAIDQKWFDLLSDTYRFQEQQHALNDPWDSIPLHDSLWSTETFKSRLALLDQKTPFHITYNASLEKIVRNYLKNRRPQLERLMGVSHYYFPMFEEVFAQYGLPLEMKYLAIVESALVPTATSRVGARGLWQFMFQTGKMFDLKVNSYVDERCSPLKSTIAAAKYLNQLYDILDDWDLALAAYNSGPGNVSKAIRRSGGRKNYWNIRSFLPRETAGYLPAFYATMYLFEYAHEYGLNKSEAKPHFATTDTLTIKQTIALSHVSQLAKTPIETLEFLNPQYSLGLIPYIESRPYTLRLPLADLGLIDANQDSLYTLAKADFDQREQPLPELMDQNNRIRYRVRSGDYLGKIANKYGVSVTQIKRWNGLKSTQLKIGQRLTIIPRRIPVNDQTKRTSSTGSGAQEVYVVKRGDSLWGIAQKFPGISPEDLKKWNGISGSEIKPGMTLSLKPRS